MATASVMKSTDEDAQKCWSCHAPSLLLDWAAGDLVCTNCGVVNEEHVRDEGPEWREFNDDNDIAKATSAKSRSGMVTTDDSRYLGGLEPTRLSKQAFGGAVRSNGRFSVKNLKKTNRQIDFLMMRQNAKALKQAKLSRQLERKRRLLQRDDDGETDTTDVDENPSAQMVMPDHDLVVVQEEEDAIRRHAALLADKWSLKRALLLHGRQEEQDSTSNSEEERQDLIKCIDKTQIQASADLYLAYTLLQRACRDLNLPHRVVHEATTMLAKYAGRRNGFHVKGVSSRMSKRSNKEPSSTEEKEAEKQALNRLRQYNKLKQIAALGSALTFLTARHLGWQRSMVEVCAIFSKSNATGVASGENALKTQNGAPIRASRSEIIDIKPKHCFRAIQHIKDAFPDYAQALPTTMLSLDTSTIDADRFVEHSIRKLELPPVALKAITVLVARHYQQPNQDGQTTMSTTTLSTICASMTLFMCTVGSLMQQLAQQAKQRQSAGGGRSLKRKSAVLWSTSKGGHNAKKLFKPDDESGRENFDETAPSLPISHPIAIENAQSKIPATTKPRRQGLSDEKPTAIVVKVEKSFSRPFDVFSHEPVKQDAAAKAEYEARRIWDAWTEQMTWSRSPNVVEQSCGVSRSALLDHYKKYVVPNQEELLNIIQNAATSADHYLADTPLASVLMSNIVAAAPLLKNTNIWRD